MRGRRGEWDPYLLPGVGSGVRTNQYGGLQLPYGGWAGFATLPLPNQGGSLLLPPFWGRGRGLAILPPTQKPKHEPLWLETLTERLMELLKVLRDSYIHINTTLAVYVQGYT